MERIIGELEGSDDRLTDLARDLYTIVRELDDLVRTPLPALDEAENGEGG